MFAAESSCLLLPLFSLYHRLRRVRVSKKGDTLIKDAAEDVFMGSLCGGPSGKAVLLKQALVMLSQQVKVLGVPMADSDDVLQHPGLGALFLLCVPQICGCRQAAETEVMLFSMQKISKISLNNVFKRGNSTFQRAHQEPSELQEKEQALSLSLAHSLGRNLTQIQGLDPLFLDTQQCCHGKLINIGKIIPEIAGPLQPPKDRTTNRNMFLR